MKSCNQNENHRYPRDLSTMSQGSPSPLPNEVQKLQQMNDKLFAQLSTGCHWKSDTLAGDQAIEKPSLSGAYFESARNLKEYGCQKLSSFDVMENKQASCAGKSHVSPSLTDALDYSTHIRGNNSTTVTSSTCVSQVGSCSSPSTSPSSSLPDNCSISRDLLDHWKRKEHCSPVCCRESRPMLKGSVYPSASAYHSDDASKLKSTDLSINSSHDTQMKRTHSGSSDPPALTGITPVRRRGRLKKNIAERQSPVMTADMMVSVENQAERSGSSSQTMALKRHLPGGALSVPGSNTRGTVSTVAGYKYLTWREKDRRRRFREEWKHLWLVIPHGRYEVMCLMCHKVMTQRKLDTIKRHTVRRHVELLGMPELDRQDLFEQLMRQHSLSVGSENTTPPPGSLVLGSKSKMSSVGQPNKSSSGMRRLSDVVEGRHHFSTACLRKPVRLKTGEGCWTTTTAGMAPVNSPPTEVSDLQTSSTMMSPIIFSTVSLPKKKQRLGMLNSTSGSPVTAIGDHSHSSKIQRLHEPTSSTTRALFDDLALTKPFGEVTSKMDNPIPPLSIPNTFGEMFSKPNYFSYQGNFSPTKASPPFPPKLLPVPMGAYFPQPGSNSANNFAFSQLLEHLSTTCGTMSPTDACSLPVKPNHWIADNRSPGSHKNVINPDNNLKSADFRQAGNGELFPSSPPVPVAPVELHNTRKVVHGGGSESLSEQSSKFCTFTEDPSVSYPREHNGLNPTPALTSMAAAAAAVVTAQSLLRLQPNSWTSLANTSSAPVVSLAQHGAKMPLDLTPMLMASWAAAIAAVSSDTSATNRTVMRSGATAPPSQLTSMAKLAQLTSAPTSLCFSSWSGASLTCHQGKAEPQEVVTRAVSPSHAKRTGSDIQTMGCGEPLVKQRNPPLLKRCPAPPPPPFPLMQWPWGVWNGARQQEQAVSSLPPFLAPDLTPTSRPQGTRSSTTGESLSQPVFDLNSNSCGAYSASAFSLDKESPPDRLSHVTSRWQNKTMPELSFEGQKTGVNDLLISNGEQRDESMPFKNINTCTEERNCKALPLSLREAYRESKPASPTRERFDSHGSFSAFNRRLVPPPHVLLNSAQNTTGGPFVTPPAALGSYTELLRQYFALSSTNNPAFPLPRPTFNSCRVWRPDSRVHASDDFSNSSWAFSQPNSSASPFYGSHGNREKTSPPKAKRTNTGQGSGGVPLSARDLSSLTIDNNNTNRMEDTKLAEKACWNGPGAGEHRSLPTDAAFAPTDGHGPAEVTNQGDEDTQIADLEKSKTEARFSPLWWVSVPGPRTVPPACHLQPPCLTETCEDAGETADRKLLSPDGSLVIHILRLGPGQDLRASLTHYVLKQRLAGSFVITCCGSVTKAHLRLANLAERHLSGPFEIVSLVGTLSNDGYPHLHIALADSSGSVFGGHLLGATTVHTTAEVVLGATGIEPGPLNMIVRQSPDSCPAGERQTTYSTSETDSPSHREGSLCGFSNSMGEHCGVRFLRRRDQSTGFDELVAEPIALKQPSVPL